MNLQGLLKQPTHKRLRNWLVLILVVALVGLVVYHRGSQLYSCVAAKYDLRRETNFRWLTGRCTATGRDGGQVYVDQLRAFGNGTDDHDADHH